MVMIMATTDALMPNIGVVAAPLAVAIIIRLPKAP